MIELSQGMPARSAHRAPPPSLAPLSVDSIKDRIVCSVWALGELATRARLSKSVDCSGSVLSIAIEALVRDGYLHIGELGEYVLHDEIAATMPPKDRKQTSVALATRNEAPAAPVLSTRVCNKCRKSKAEVDFYRAKDGTCKRCTLDRQKALKESKLQAAKTPKVKKAAAACAPLVDEVLVIPAGGEIRCRVLDAGAGPSFVFEQDDCLIYCCRRQLEALRDWASAQLARVTP